MFPERFCSKCRKSFQGQMLCPTCGVELAASREAALRVETKAPALDFAPAHPSIVRRTLLGFVVATIWGISLKYFAIALPTVLSIETTQFPAQLPTFVALMLGAGLAGAGHPRGAILGTLVGLLVGFTTIASDFRSAHSENEMLQALLPMALFAVLGMGFGVLGRTVWPPLAELPFEPKRTVAAPPKDPKEMLRRAAVPWIRTVICSFLVIAGAWYADGIRTFLMQYTGRGSAHIQQFQLIAFIIFMLITLVMGCVVGMRTEEGIRNGQIVGLIAGFGIAMLMYFKQVIALPAGQFVLDYFGLPITQGKGQPPMMNLFTMVATTFVLATFGGWMGSQLILEPRRRIDR